MTDISRKAVEEAVLTARTRVDDDGGYYSHEDSDPLAVLALALRDRVDQLEKLTAVEKFDKKNSRREAILEQRGRNANT